MTDIVFPEDKGTGAYPDSDVARGSDTNDAAHFAAHVYAAQPLSALIEGGQISNYDAVANSITVNGGIASVTEHDIIGDINPVTHDSGTFVVDFDQRTISLTDSSGINEIYLTIDLSNNDSIIVEAVSDGSEPTRPAVKIGEVDTANDIVSDQWNLITEGGTLSYPDADAANAALTSFQTGVTVIDRSNNTRITNSNLEAGDTVLNGSLEAGNTVVNGSLEAGDTVLNGSLEAGDTVLNGGLEAGNTVVNGSLEAKSSFTDPTGTVLSSDSGIRSEIAARIMLGL